MASANKPTWQSPAEERQLGPAVVSPHVRTFIARHRVARLATADTEGVPHVIPIVYVYEGGCLYFALDAKPKRVPPERLKRVRNIVENPSVAIVIDDYMEDWSRLAYVLIQGMAQVLKEGEERDRALALLKNKYPQYQGMALGGSWVVKIPPQWVIPWGIPLTELS